MTPVKANKFQWSPGVCVNESLLYIYIYTYLDVQTRHSFQQFNWHYELVRIIN